MPRTGRPREFDRDLALHRAMELFWANGYEGTTLSELQRVMGGITAPSFYAAFGSKEQLFREAVDHYNATEGAPFVDALMGGETAHAAIERWLRAVARSFADPSKPRGCFVVLGALNCQQANSDIRDFLHEQRKLRDKVIRQRIRRGVDEGDLPRATNVDALAAFYSSVVNGMAVQARDGASRKTLNAVVDYAMSAWGLQAESASSRPRQGG